MDMITRRRLMVQGGKAAVGASALAAFLTACGGSSGASAEELKYWAMGYQPKGANAAGKLTDAAVKAFMDKHTNVKVQVTGYTPDQAGFTKLTQNVRGGNSVDIFRIPSDELPVMIEQNLVASIDEHLTSEDKADIYANLLETTRYEGKNYAWPLWVPPVGMYINADIFQERGVALPDENWTYDEFVEIAKQLTFTRADGTKVYGYTGLIDAAVVNTWPFILGDGATPLSKDNKKYALNSPEGITGLQKLVDLAQKHKVTPPDFGAQSTDDIASGFSQLKSYAMYSAPSGDASNYKTLGMNFDVRPMPIGGRGKHFTLGGVGLIAVANIKDETRRKGAMELARYLTSGDVAKDVDGYYLAPGSRASVQVNDPISKFSPFVENTYLLPIIPQWSQIRLLLHPQFQEAVLGKKSVSDALNSVASEIDSLLSS